MPHSLELEEAIMNRIAPAFDKFNDPFGPEGVLHLTIDFAQRFMDKTESRLLSKPIVVRGIPWRILALCRAPGRGGSNSLNRQQQQSSRNYSLGFFLQCNNEDLLMKRGLWRCYGSATLEVLSTNGGPNISKKIHHSFHNNEVDWGFTSFESFDTLLSAEHGYVQDDKIILRCHFTADVPNGNGFYWDSKLHTGCIGLRNQGATCYMNSILQAFYFTTGFRKAVYQMEVGSEPSDTNICLAMQRVFYELQTAKEAVETNSLTRAFGWDKLDAFNQHDVQEFCRVLLDNLETKMKGSSQEQSIPQLFRGNMKSFIKCTEVEYESSRTESFYDVQLNVLGMDSLERAFEAYTATEILEGDNKYDAGEFGLQRAEKGVKFVELPPVLHVQLMRFQYCGVEQKVNERFTFPKEMNLIECCELSDQLKADDCVYSLHAVLVHSGEFHGGHYVTFINTNIYESSLDSSVKPKWCKFDDDVVSRTTDDDAITSNFGGERSMNTSAYMLIYVRNTSIKTVLAPIPDDEIPKKVEETFEEERLQKNKMRKKKEEESMCIEMPIVTQDIIAGNHGFDLVEFSVIQDQVSHESINKNMTLFQLYKFIERRLFGTDRSRNSDSAMELEDDEMYDEEDRQSFRFRLWKMSETYMDREGTKTLSRFRPDLLLDSSNKVIVEKVFSSEYDAIYVEVPAQGDRLQPYSNTADHVLAFIKYYDSISQTFNIVGTYIFDIHRPLSYYRDPLCKLAGIAPGTELAYYEEISANRIYSIEKPNSQDAIGHWGDDGGVILIIEQAEYRDAENNALAKFDEMYKTTFIEFHEQPFNKKHEDDLIQPIVKKVRLDSTLASVTEQLARELDYDPKNVLVWYKGQSGRAEPCLEDYSKYSTKSITGRTPHDPRVTKKYRANYSLMPFPVSEMHLRKQMKIFAMNDKMEVEELTIFPLQDGHLLQVGDILSEAKRYFKFAENGSGKLRLVQVGTSPNFNRVYQIYSENVAVHEIESKYLYKCRVEEVPVDELECAIDEFFCPVVHFDRDPTSRLFGTSFVIKVKNGELMSEVRERLRSRLPEVSSADFAKFKFALLSRDKLCRYIEFGDADKVNLQDMASQTTGNIPQVYIGIDHKSPVLHSNENAIRILN